MEPIWRNTPFMVLLISALLFVVGAIALGSIGIFDKDVTVNYDYEHNEINGNTIVEIRLWNETDAVKIIDGDGFRLGDVSLTGWSTVILDPYGYRTIKVFCEGFHDGSLTYIHGDHVSMNIVRNHDIIPDE